MTDATPRPDELLEAAALVDDWLNDPERHQGVPVPAIRTLVRGVGATWAADPHDLRAWRDAVLAAELREARRDGR